MQDVEHVEDVLGAAYEAEHLGESAASLAAEFGLTERFVFRLLDKHDIPRRGCVKELDMPLAELKRRYLEDRVELQDLAAMLGVSRGTVSRRLAEAGVTVPLGARPLDLPVDEILERRQRNETLKEIAAVYDVSVPTIRRRLDQAEKAAESA
nr:hypothetical protein OG781_09735 [Streptomyces sp. NBC_00830]